MKKSLFIMALGAIALTSCSQDEVLEVKQDAISFATATENASRASVITNAAVNADDSDFEFKVWAYETGTDAPYITAKLVSQDYTGGGAGKYQLEETYYWPIKNLDFYAIYPSSQELTTAAGGAKPTISTYTVDSNHDVDLLYSVSMNTEKGDGVANINFRHALAMIQFNIASDAVYGLDVEVTEINIVNIAKTNSYTLPRTTTTAAINTNRGEWTASPTQTGTYTWTEDLNYTFATTDEDVTAGDVHFLLPQKITPSVPSSTTWTGTYFKIKCKLSKNGVDVHDAYVAVPATAPDNEWKEGNKYIYTLKFGQGGGYIPDTENPAIIPISFEITVDDMNEVIVPEVPVEAPTV